MFLWQIPKIRINQKSSFASGPHRKWCEILRKNVLSCVVHTISGVIRNSKYENAKSFDISKLSTGQIYDCSHKLRMTQSKIKHNIINELEIAVSLENRIETFFIVVFGCAAVEIQKSYL